MEYRRLGASGLMVPLLSFGAATFGGTGEFFSAQGTTENTAAARRMIDLCLAAGVTMFRTRRTSIPTATRRLFSAKP